MIVVKRYMGGHPQTKIDFYNRYVYQKDMKGGQSMSLYNMVNGFNPACIFIMPLLGRRDSEYPRFRDCFVEDDKIAIFYSCRW